MDIRGRLRAIRHGPDRRLHALRRQRAVEMLRRRRRPAAVLFICHGNIYRSPYAAAVFAGSLPPEVAAGIRVLSAGFVGPDRPSPENAVELATRRGVDLRAHRSRLITPEALEDVDLVVVMDPAQKRTIASRFPGEHSVLVLGDLDPEPIETRAIEDPWRQTADVLERSYSRVERCARELARIIEQGW